MSDKRLIPKVRFEGFDDEWREKELANITKRVRGNDGRLDIPTLTISAANGWMDQRDRFYGNIAGKEQKNYTLLKNGELSYNKGNSKFAKYGVVYELTDFSEGLVPKVYHSFSANPDIESSYLEYYFHTKRPDKQLGESVTTTARMDGLLNISYDDFMKVTINYPSLSEQKAIASFLRAIDKRINKYEKYIKNISDFKQSMLQKLFPKEDETVPEVRFGEFVDNWVDIKLGEISSITTGKLDANAMIENGKYDFFTSGIKKYKIDTYAFEGPAITIAGNGATVGYMHLANGKFNAYQRTYVLSDFEVDRMYLFYEIQNRLPNKIKEEARAGNIPYIVMDMLTDLKIKLPSNEEQVLIGNYFKNLDQNIQSKQAELKKIKQFKQAMLDKMFV